MSKYRALLTHSGPSPELIPVPICTLGGWHPESHRAVMHTATVSAPKTREFLFQRHAALLVAGNANCIVQVWALEM